MNKQLRRLATVTLVLFVALLVAGTDLQFFQAGSLNADPRNSRTIYKELSKDRGPIVVGGQTIASSTPVDDNFKYQRTYSDAALYAPVTGYFPVYGQATGIEGAENSELSGTADSQFFSRIQSLLTGKDPQGGMVELTIDPKVQQAAYDAFGSQLGAAVAMDPKTGKILAMVSLPSYDPNTLATHDKSAFDQTYAALNADPNKPLVNKAINQTYQPGSVFKLITASTALENGYTMDSMLPAPDALPLPGSTAEIHNPAHEQCGNGQEVPMWEALKYSCNTPFASLGMTLGAQKINDEAEKYGYGQSFYVPMRVTPSVFPADADQAQTAMAAMGQYNDQVTPMQIAMTTSAIANGGVEMSPYLVDTIRDANLTITSQTKPTQFSNPISANTASQLTTMMEGVVNGGTGKTVAIPGVQVAAKTGTAQTTSEAAPHAWFTAFAPADNPQVAVAVVVEHGGDLGDDATGAAVAGPIAKKIIEAVLNQ